MSRMNSVHDESNTKKLESDCVFMSVENLLVLDNDELSGCWLDNHHDIKYEELYDIDDIGECLSFNNDDNVSFHEDIFEDCNDMEIEPLGDIHHQDSFGEDSHSAPPQEHSHDSKIVRQDSCQTLPPPSLAGNELYDAALNNLESCMRRSELSRAQVLHHRASLSPNVRDRMNLPQQVHNQHHSRTNLPQPSPSTVSSLADLFSGKRTALTVGLEQSRDQLRMYMSVINTNQPF